MFSGRQPRQYANVLRPFGNWLRPHLQGVASGLVEQKLITVCPTVFCLYPRSATRHIRNVDATAQVRVWHVLLLIVGNSEVWCSGVL
jgi:hypothetical protein